MFIKPDYNYKSIYDINLEELKSSGITALLFDLDSTIMASKSGCYSKEMETWLKKVKAEFFIAVISNNKNPAYINKVTSISDFPLVFKAKKPNIAVAKKFLEGQKLKASECAFIGDRPLTDILCGKLLGCKTILVDSITAESETKLVRFARYLERLSIKK